MRIATLISVQTIVLLQGFYVGSHELKDSEELRSPCQPPSSHFVCDEATGKLKCAEEWKGSSCNENGKLCSHNISLQRHSSKMNRRIMCVCLKAGL